MAGKVRVGIVGATVTPGGSGWGANAHVPALQALPEYELTAVCTAHEETARASAAAFGAELAFHDFDQMVARPEVDLVAVVVRVPGHRDLVVRALEAGKAVFCEWPLGATLAEAEAMAELAATRALRTAVGLQARSDPALRYARELIQEGYVGEVLAGANTLTIAGGHAIDALCFLVGEPEEVTARLATRITEWHNTDTGETMAVDSPDWVSLSARLSGGAEVSVLVATVPSSPSGNRIEVYGREGALVVEGGAPNIGPNRLSGARGGEPLAVLEPPAHFSLVPEGTPAGSPRNVAQAYARLAQAIAAGERFEPDFAHAVRRHALLQAIERASEEGRAVRV
jgi:predicted dehydrogenase